MSSHLPHEGQHHRRGSLSNANTPPRSPWTGGVPTLSGRAGIGSLTIQVQPRPEHGQAEEGEADTEEDASDDAQLLRSPSKRKGHGKKRQCCSSLVRGMTRRWGLLVMLLTIPAFLALLLLLLLRASASECATPSPTAGSPQSLLCKWASSLGSMSANGPSSTSSSLGRAHSPPDLPTVPFTLFSLMRDLPSDEELLATRQAMNSNSTYLMDHLAPQSIQLTALHSWLALTRFVIIFMDTSESCAKLRARPGMEDVQCFPVPCAHPEFARPLLDCLFHAAHVAARTDLIGFVNGDIVLDRSLAHIVTRVEQVVPPREHFLVVARRTDTPLTRQILEEGVRDPAGNVRAVLSRAAQVGLLHNGMGIDLFVYRRSMLELLHYDPKERDMALYKSGYDLTNPAFRGTKATGQEALHFPPFLAGVYRWDNWFLSEMLVHPSVRVIDATDAAAMTGSPLVVHQEVDAAALLGDELGGGGAAGEHASNRGHTSRRGAGYNDAIVKGISKTAYKLGSIDNAQWGMQREGGKLVLKPNTHASPQVLFRQRSTFVNAPADGPLVLRTKGDEASADAQGDATSPVSRPIGGWLVLVPASSLDTPLILNWLCWARRNEFDHFVFLARDRATATLVTAHAGGAAVLTAPDAPARSRSAAESASFVTWSTRMVREALSASIHVVMLPVQSVWVKPGLQLFEHMRYGPGDTHAVMDLWAAEHTQTGATPTDAAAAVSPPPRARSPPHLDAHLFVLNPSNMGHHVWKQTSLCLDRELEQAHAHHSPNASTAHTPAPAHAAHAQRPPAQLLDLCFSNAVWSARGNTKWAMLDSAHFPTASALTAPLTSTPSPALIVDLRVQAAAAAAAAASPHTGTGALDWPSLQRLELSAVGSEVAHAAQQLQPDTSDDNAPPHTPLLTCLPPPVPALPPVHPEIARASAHAT